MLIILSPDERETAKKALGRIKRVTEAASKALTNADLETMKVDAQLSEIDGALTAIESAGENEEVELIAIQRRVIRVGLNLLESDCEQTKSRELSLGIETAASVQRIDELQRLARRLGDQQEMELTTERLGFPSSQVGAPAAEVVA